MHIRLKNFKEDLVYFLRGLGYSFMGKSGEEWSFVRRISGQDYPRFHAYAKKDKGETVINLHLDQKKPSYEGAKKHSGEYDGELVEAEAKRIKSFVK